MRALQISAKEQMVTLTGMNRMQSYNQFEQGQTLDQVRRRLRLCAGSGSNPGGHDRTKKKLSTDASEQRSQGILSGDRSRPGSV